MPTGEIGHGCFGDNQRGALSTGGKSCLILIIWSKPVVGEVMGIRWEPTITTLLNGHAVKQPSEYFGLYHQLVLLSTFAGKAAFCGTQQ